MKIIIFDFEKEIIINRLKVMIKSIKSNNRTDICPQWNFHNKELSSISSCKTCEKLFPNILNTTLCPCNIYKPSYLIKRLRQIIKDNEYEKI